MFNDNSLKIPAKSFPSHKVIFDGLYFFKKDEFNLYGVNTPTNQTTTLQSGTELLVLEHGVGYLAKWCKVQLQDGKIGYVLLDTNSGTSLAPVSDLILPFYNLAVEEQYLPNPNKKEINWKKQKPNVAYEDSFNGAMVVHYEMINVVQISDQNELAVKMEEARKEGLKIILEHAGLKTSEEDLNSLLNNYYLFCTSEDWFFDVRPCSTLRIAVVVPLRYLYAKNEAVKDTTGLSIPSAGLPEETPPPPDQFFTLHFENYQKYKDFFDKLIETLGRYNLTYISKPWDLTPDGGVDFLFEIQQIKSFINSTNLLISINHPNLITEIPEIPFISPPQKTWKNSLDFVIDKNSLEIKTIKLFSNNKTFSLMNGFVTYLRSPEIENKTTINYLINFDPEKDFYVPERQKSDFQKAIESPTDALAKAASILGAGLGSLSGAQRDEELKTFLTSKHYPKIDDIRPTPLDLYKCTVDNASRVAQLVSCKLPAEREKWKELNQNYEVKRPQVEWDLFRKNLATGIKAQMPTEITDPNLRILFGIDKLDDLDAKDKLITYLTIANTLDWGKYLGVAAQCLMSGLPPNVIMELMKDYKEARKFIEQIIGATVCNPFIKNALKVINGFQLPVLEVSNPSEILAQELEAAYYKILTDLISTGIKKLLEAAAKACAGSPKQNFNNNSAAPSNPFDDNANANDPAVNDILDDFNKAIGASPNNAIAKRQAKETLNQIIADISACLSLREICSLYNSNTVNDEVYQLIISLIKRKYGDPYARAFSTREQISRFFTTLGKNMDLTICQDLNVNPDLPYNANPNILCDDGRVTELRQQLLADHGLTPDLINSALDAIRADETKALEDVLKVLDSYNPFDFSKAPDLACKVFPSGVSVAPSMNSFSSMIDSLIRPVYDSFDRESTEWYRTTYSIKNTESPQFLLFNSSSGEIEVNPDVNISSDTGKHIKANSGKTDPATQENDSKLDGSKEIKMPAYVFKDTLNSGTSNISYVSINDTNPAIKNNYVYYTANLDGNKQKNLDLNFITDDLIGKVNEGEAKLTNFVSKFIAQLAANLAVDIASIANYAARTGLSLSEIRAEASNNTQQPDAESQDVFSSVVSIFNTVKPLETTFRLMDMYLRNNSVDAESTKFALKDLYNYLNITNIEESNGFFARESGAALYLVLGEMLFSKYTWSQLEQIVKTPEHSEPVPAQVAVLNTTYDPSQNLSVLYSIASSSYGEIKDYYRAIFKVKINYPDFDINYKTGMDQASFLATGSILTYSSYQNDKLHEIQSLEILRNKSNYIKSTEINQVNENIVNYITGVLGVNLSGDVTKKDLFFTYLQKKSNQFNSGRISSLGDTKNVVYEKINKKIYDEMSSSLLSINNKFVHIKDISSPFISSVAETGSGDPYTHYLQLVIPQTPQQKNCNVRPHYLDIDSIKDQIVDERSKNMCVETTADNRTFGNKPISTNDLQNIETTSTQDTMLRGAYRLVIRIYLHDILLRGIPVFGAFDPQSLRDEPAFISFMAKMAESEIRGTDNGFFIMLTEFLLKQYRTSNPKEVIENDSIKKSLLFRDVVKDELQKFVLPKLAKRINSDTNEKLLNNIPKDKPIRLVNVTDIDYVKNIGIISVSGNSVYINTDLTYYSSNTGINQNFQTNAISVGPQKIYEGAPNDDELTTYSKFVFEPEFEFLFKYLFPATQPLNYYFMLSCLSTSTRRQIVNSFLGTKNIAIQICKSIQTNGQRRSPDANDMQASAFDPLDLIIGFLLKSLLTTPQKILKGVVEGSEPNVALVSTAFKLARSFVPKLPSVMIPAVSIPVAMIPTPITSPMPYINPIMALTYFAALCWYDEKEDSKETANKELEKLVTAPKIDCADVKNQDQFYLDNAPIQQGQYILSKDTSVLNSQYAGEVFDTTPENLKNSAMAIVKNERNKVLNDIYASIKSQDYQYNLVTITDAGSVLVPKTEKISDFIMQHDGSFNDQFYTIIKTIAEDVEKQINTKRSLTADVDQNDTQADDGSFNLIPDQIVKKVNNYVAKEKLIKLREKTDYANYAAAYQEAYSYVLNESFKKISFQASNEKMREVNPPTPTENIG